MVTIQIGKNRDPVILEFYGRFRGHPFGIKDMVVRYIKRVILVHDAVHSIALFLTQMDTCDIAMHNYVPFSFPNTKEHTIEYTQRYDYPLLVTTLDIPVEDLLRKNGCPTMWRRWCTRAFKERVPREVYKHFYLNGITQVKGMTRFQSPDRAKYNPNHEIDQMLSQERFKVYSELPIFNMTEEEQYRLADEAGIAPSIYTRRYGAHGCMFCPFKSERYWLALREQDPELYAQCDTWRGLSIYCVPEGKTPKEYFYYPKSQVM
jgi:hypothetical protein